MQGQLVTVVVELGPVTVAVKVWGWLAMTVAEEGSTVIETTLGDELPPQPSRKTAAPASPIRMRQKFMNDFMTTFSP